jgi:hypothetical protein
MTQLWPDPTNTVSSVRGRLCRDGPLIPLMPLGPMSPLPRRLRGCDRAG